VELAVRVVAEQRQHIARLGPPGGLIHSGSQHLAGADRLDRTQQVLLLVISIDEVCPDGVAAGFVGVDRDRRGDAR
jgi:hypothetical protein